MHYTPTDYQVIATEFVRNNRSCALLLDCGTGKTAVTLAAIRALGLHKVIVMAPPLVVNGWVEEAQKWDAFQDLSVLAITGSPKQRLAKLRQESDIKVVPSSLTVWLRSNVDLNAMDMIVLDESSQFKSYSAQRTRAVLGLTQPRKVILTGTPIPRDIEDLHTQFRFLDLGARLYPTLTAFRQDFMILRDPKRFIYTPKPGAAQRVFDRIRDITVSALGDSLNLPPIIARRTAVTMTPGERAVYNTLVTEHCLRYRDEKFKALNAGVLTGMLTRLSSGFLYTDHESVISVHHHKDEALSTLLAASAALGENVLVVYMFTEERRRIQAVSESLGLTALDMKSDQAVAQFKSGRASGLVGMCHPASAGMGINLQANCHRLIWYSLPWSYEQYYQMYHRIYRQGQTQTVYIHFIETENSVDQRIMVTLNDRKELNQHLFRITDGYLEDFRLAQRGHSNENVS